MACINFDMFTYASVKRTWLVVSTVFSKLKDFPSSEATTYMVSVTISRKRCKIVVVTINH